MIKLSPNGKGIIFGPSGINPNGLWPQWKRHGSMKDSFSKWQWSW